MFFLFPLSAHLQRRTLEDIAVVVTVRWLLFLPLCFIASAAVIWLVERAGYSPALSPKDASVWLFLAIALWVVLACNDVRRIRRDAKKWPEHRLQSTSSIKKLPYLLLILVPCYFLTEGGRSETMRWAAEMLWVFDVLAAAFYVTYFLLLLSIFRLPRPASILGFVIAVVAGIHGFQGRFPD